MVRAHLLSDAHPKLVLCGHMPGVAHLPIRAGIRRVVVDQRREPVLHRVCRDRDPDCPAQVVAAGCHRPWRSRLCANRHLPPALRALPTRHRSRRAGGIRPGSIIRARLSGFTPALAALFQSGRPARGVFRRDGSGASLSRATAAPAAIRVGAGGHARGHLGDGRDSFVALYGDRAGQLVHRPHRIAAVRSCGRNRAISDRAP
jgi:hypothetical protein